MGNLGGALLVPNLIDFEKKQKIVSLSISGVFNFDTGKRDFFFFSYAIPPANTQFQAAYRPTKKSSDKFALSPLFLNEDHTKTVFEGRACMTIEEEEEEEEKDVNHDRFSSRQNRGRNQLPEETKL